jgi:hypothetical protein
MRIVVLIFLAMAFGSVAQSSENSLRNEFVHLSKDEECVVSFFTQMTIVMGAASFRADDAMKRLAERTLDQAGFFEEELEACKEGIRNANSWPSDRFELILEIAKCRYHDLLFEEYRPDETPDTEGWEQCRR